MFYFSFLVLKVNGFFYSQGLAIWLMPFSTIFQLYCAGNRSTQRKPSPWCKSLTNFIKQPCIEYTSPWACYWRHWCYLDKSSINLLSLICFAWNNIMLRYKEMCYTLKAEKYKSYTGMLNYTESVTLIIICSHV
jgi:hypothetical protein